MSNSKTDIERKNHLKKKDHWNRNNIKYLIHSFLYLCKWYGFFSSPISPTPTPNNSYSHSHPLTVPFPSLALLLIKRYVSFSLPPFPHLTHQPNFLRCKIGLYTLICCFSSISLHFLPKDVILLCGVLFDCIIDGERVWGCFCG